MRILIVSTTIFPLPPTGYSGLEMLTYQIAVGMQKKGHQVSVVAPQGSQLPEGIELIPTGIREAEQAVYMRYKDRLEKGDWDVVHDHSWEAWPYMSAVGHEPALPILHTLHTSPTIYGKPPPVMRPCFVGISDSHCQDIRLHLGIDARRVYNGIDLIFYAQDAGVKRNGRYLFLGRYTPEKGPLVAINLASRLRFALDCVGDVEIVGNPEYVDRCRNLCDGLLVRFRAGVSRDETVKLYRSSKALLFPLQWSEPFGLSIVEASACGLPVLTLRKGAMPELVKDGENGWAFWTEGDLEDAIKQDWPSKIDPVRARAVAERFSLQAMIDGYEELYKDVANGVRW